VRRISAVPAARMEPRTKERLEEEERIQKQKGRAATVTRTMNTKPVRARNKPEPFQPPAPVQKRAASEPPAKRAKASPSRKTREIELDVAKLAAALRAHLTGRGTEFVDLEEADRLKSTTVLDVDKILAVKVNAKGGLMYQILWEDGSSSWEPEDNVMDDDLVDEFEAAEQAKAYSSHDIAVGSEVEVKNVDEGFENSWSTATVTKVLAGGTMYAVEFAGFVSEDGEAESETVERERLRLVPDKADKSWAPVVGEILEVNEDDCWWEARVMAVEGKKVKVQLRVSDELKTSTLGSRNLRPCSWLNMANKKAAK